MLIYTFRTFPWTSELPKNTFIFGKLKEDFKKFKKIILAEKPDLILGIAKAVPCHSREGGNLYDQSTRAETKAINRFNKTKKIIKDGPESYDLYLPDFANGLKLASKPSDSFCNWTIYKIANFIEEQNLNTKVSFIHITKSDLQRLQ